MHDTVDFPALQAIGLNPAMQAQLALGVADPLARPMRLVEVQCEHLLLHDGCHTLHACCSTVLHHALQAQGETLAIGDWVLARPDAPGGCSVVCRLLRTSQLTRRSSGGRGNDPPRRHPPPGAGEPCGHRPAGDGAGP